jgi:hypothetical protein
VVGDESSRSQTPDSKGHLFNSCINKFIATCVWSTVQLISSYITLGILLHQTSQAQHQIEQQNVIYNQQLAYLLYIFPSYPLFTIKNVFDACNCSVTAAYRVLENHTSTVVRERATNSREMRESSWMSSNSQPSGNTLPLVSSVPVSSYFSTTPFTTYAFCDMKPLENGDMQPQVATLYPIPSHTSGMYPLNQIADSDTRMVSKPHLPTTTTSLLDSGSPVPYFSASDVSRGSSTSASSALGYLSFCVSSEATGSKDAVCTAWSKTEQTTHDAATALIQLTVKSATSLSN